MKYRITASRPDDIQYTVETYDDSREMANRILLLTDMGYDIHNVESFSNNISLDNLILVE